MNFEKLSLGRQTELKKTISKIDSRQNDSNRSILEKYGAAIEPNFTYWMSAAMLSAKSKEARNTAEENLTVEIEQDHRKMLRFLLEQTDAIPNYSEYLTVKLQTEKIHEIASKGNGLANLTVIAILENASLIFIPKLEEISIALGATDLKYTKVHGEADLAHAQAFLKALEYEKQQHNNPNELILEASNATYGLLNQIFKC